MSYQAVIAAHRATFDRLTERVAVARLKKVYDVAQAELEAKLARAVGRGRAESMTAHQHRVMLLQVHDAQSRLAGKMAQEMSAAAQHARAEAVRQLHADVARLDSHFGGAAVQLPTEAAGAFHDLVGRGRTSLLAAHQASMARYGGHLVAKMEGGLGLSLATGETPHEAIQRVMDVADTEWWQAERIVRTEQAWAVNAATRDAIAEGAREDQGLWARWVEHASDAGAPLDDRVGVDSLAMHGQVAHSGEQFTMPPTAPSGEAVSKALVGQSWAHPPNRPNDRAVLAPWRADWGVQGWRWAGARVPVLPTPEVAREAEVAKPKRSRKPRVAVEPAVEAPLPVRTQHQVFSDTVTRGKVVDDQPVAKSGVNESRWMTWDDGGTGHQVTAIFKSKVGEQEDLRDNVHRGTYAYREVAAANLAPMFGVEVPPTVLTSAPITRTEYAWDAGTRTVTERTEAEHGSAQLKLSGVRTVPELREAEGHEHTFDREAMERLRVFDFVIGNTDRHFGNVMFKTEGEGVYAKHKPIGIDHGLAFPYKEGISFRDELPNLYERDRSMVGPLLDPTRAAIAGLDPAAIAESLARDNLETSAIVLTLSRLRLLQKEGGSFLAMPPHEFGEEAVVNIKAYRRAASARSDYPANMISAVEEDEIKRVVTEAGAKVRKELAAKRRREAAAKKKESAK